MVTHKSMDTRKLVLLSLLTAIVIVLQILAFMVRGPVFSLTLVLVPIVIGAALIGPLAGAWLGLVFGAIVLASGDANVFIAINPIAAVGIVLVRGLMAGLLAGAVYKLFAEKNKTFATFVAAIISPIINTGLFVAGMYLFFWPTITEWATFGGYASAATFLFVGMIGFNFLMEMAINITLCPAIVRLVQYGKKA